jgi:hypothetical protein
VQGTWQALFHRLRQRDEKRLQSRISRDEVHEEIEEPYELGHKAVRIADSDTRDYTIHFSLVLLLSIYSKRISFKSRLPYVMFYFYRNVVVVDRQRSILILVPE